MKNHKGFLIALITAITLFLLSSCQNARKTLNLDTTAVLQIHAFNDSNPDSDGRPSPTVIRIYQLTDARQFSRETFIRVYENAEKRLGDDLLSSLDLREILPNEKRLETLPLKKEVKYLGVLAEFYQYEDAEPMMILPIISHKKNHLDINIYKNFLHSSVALNDSHRRIKALSAAATQSAYQKTRKHMASNNTSKEKHDEKSVKPEYFTDRKLAE